jgi:hypothetical protein
MQIARDISTAHLSLSTSIRKSSFLKAQPYTRFVSSLASSNCINEIAGSSSAITSILADTATVTAPPKLSRRRLSPLLGIVMVGSVVNKNKLTTELAKNVRSVLNCDAGNTVTYKMEEGRGRKTLFVDGLLELERPLDEVSSWPIVVGVTILLSKLQWC